MSLGHATGKRDDPADASATVVEYAGSEYGRRDGSDAFVSAVVAVVDPDHVVPASADPDRKAAVDLIRTSACADALWPPIGGGLTQLPLERAVSILFRAAAGHEGRSCRRFQPT